MSFFLRLLTSVFLLPMLLLSEELPQFEREKLLKKIKVLEKASHQSTSQRFSSAIQSFNQAIQSDNGAYILYLKCIEKIEFEEKNKKAIDFRLWKKKNKETMDDTGFRKALRHQLNWLLLTMKASLNSEDIFLFAPQAVEKVNLLINDLDTMNGQKNLLTQNVLKTPFAKAYQIDGIHAEGWPLNPLDLKKIYQQLVFPPLRTPKQVASLRKAWDKRISHEGALAKHLSTQTLNQKTSAKSNENSHSFEKWKNNQRLVLLWEKETDCFLVGDERNAALNMVAFLEKNIHHKYAPQWHQSLLHLLDPNKNPKPSLQLNGKKQPDPQKQPLTPEQEQAKQEQENKQREEQIEEEEKEEARGRL